MGLVSFLQPHFQVDTVLYNQNRSHSEDHGISRLKDASNNLGPREKTNKTKKRKRKERRKRKKKKKKQLLSNNSSKKQEVTLLFRDGASAGADTAREHLRRHGPFLTGY